jgi:hypothetical protein
VNWKAFGIQGKPALLTPETGAQTEVCATKKQKAPSEVGAHFSTLKVYYKGAFFVKEML